MTARRLILALALAAAGLAGAFLATGLSLRLLELVATADLVAMRAWIDAHGGWLTALRWTIYASVVWLAPAWAQAPRDRRLGMRAQLVAAFVLIDALVIHQVWRGF